MPEGLPISFSNPQKTIRTRTVNVGSDRRAYLVVKPEGYLPVRTKTREYMAGDQYQYRPANDALPTMVRGPSKYTEAQKHQRFNLSANANVPAKGAPIFSRLGLLKDDYERVAA